MSTESERVAGTIGREVTLAGEVPMVCQERWEELRQLWQQDRMPIAELARRFELDHKTVRRCLRDPAWRPYQRPAPAETLLTTHAENPRTRAPKVRYSAQIQHIPGTNRALVPIMSMKISSGVMTSMSLPPAGRGRPQKFGRPSRAVTMTLPEDIIAALTAVDDDLSRAVVRLAQPLVADVVPPPLAEASKCGDRAVVVVRPVPALENMGGVTSCRRPRPRSARAIKLERH